MITDNFQLIKGKTSSLMQSFKCLIFILFFFVQNTFLYAEKPDLITSSFWHDSKMKQTLPITAGLLGASFLFDKPVNTSLENLSSDFALSAFEISDLAGDKFVVLPLSFAAFGAAHLVFKDEQMQNVALQSLQSVVVAAISVESLKQLTGRARPGYDYKSNYFKPFPGRKDEFKSFPSGHAALSFASITPYAECYSRWLYLIPGIVAAGRIYQNQHWLSDVVAGSAIGWLTAYVFIHKKGVKVIPNGLVINF